MWPSGPDPALPAGQKGVLCMKLVFAIINSDDSGSVTRSLTKNGFSSTRLATTGGFLMVGNTTLLIGTDESGVEQVKDILQKTCATRKRVANTRDSFGKGLKNDSLPDEVTVGGATIFVMDVTDSYKV